MTSYDSLKVVEDYVNNNRERFNHHELFLIKQAIMLIAGEMLRDDMEAGK